MRPKDKATARRSRRTHDAPGGRLTAGATPFCCGHESSRASLILPPTAYPWQAAPWPSPPWMKSSPGHPAARGAPPCHWASLEDDRQSGGTPCPYRCPGLRLPDLRSTTPRIVGVINVTPDSFSDGGRYLTPEKAVALGRSMVKAGADILDVGGEIHTPRRPRRCRRPKRSGASSPVIEALRPTGAVISVDTRNPETMLAAAAAGASIVNDVTALSHSPNSARIVADAGASGRAHAHAREPANDAGAALLRSRPPARSMRIFAVAVERGPRCWHFHLTRSSSTRVSDSERTGKHNLQLLAWLPMFHCLGHGLMVGASRKSLIVASGRRCSCFRPNRRFAGDCAARRQPRRKPCRCECAGGCVHDVAETRQALRVWGGSWPVDGRIGPGPRQASKLTLGIAPTDELSAVGRGCRPTPVQPAGSAASTSGAVGVGPTSPTVRILEKVGPEA